MKLAVVIMVALACATRIVRADADADVEAEAEAEEADPCAACAMASVCFGPLGCTDGVPAWVGLLDQCFSGAACAGCFPESSCASTAKAYAAAHMKKMYNEQCELVDGLERCWFTYVGTGAVAGTPTPLVVDMHGWGGSNAQLITYSGWKDVADRDGLTVIWPQGFLYYNNASKANETGWNILPADAIVDAIDGDIANDVAYLTHIINQTVGSKAATANPIDTSRTYLVGHSMGCFMSQAMAVANPDTIAAVGCMAGYLGTGNPVAPLSKAVPFIEVHGTDDNVVHYDRLKEDAVFGTGDFHPDFTSGTSGRASAWDGVGAVGNAAGWAGLNGCDLENTVDVQGEEGGQNFTTTIWKDCNQDAEVRLVTLPGVGHTPFFWPGAFPVHTTDIVWKFISQFTLTERRVTTSTTTAKAVTVTVTETAVVDTLASASAPQATATVAAVAVAAAVGLAAQVFV